MIIPGYTWQIYIYIYMHVSPTSRGISGPWKLACSLAGKKISQVAENLAVHRCHREETLPVALDIWFFPTESQVLVANHTQHSPFLWSYLVLTTIPLLFSAPRSRILTYGSLAAGPALLLGMFRIPHWWQHPAPRSCPRDGLQVVRTSRLIMMRLLINNVNCG